MAWCILLIGLLERSEADERCQHVVSSAPRDGTTRLQSVSEDNSGYAILINHPLLDAKEGFLPGVVYQGKTLRTKRGVKLNMHQLPFPTYSHILNLIPALSSFS